MIYLYSNQRNINGLLCFIERNTKGVTKQTSQANGTSKLIQAPDCQIVHLIQLRVEDKRTTLRRDLAEGNNKPPVAICDATTGIDLNQNAPY